MTHVALVDRNISELLPYYANAEGHSPHNIELDCQPGGTRPWHLIHGIIEGTGLTLMLAETGADHTFTFMGAARFDFPGTTCEEWIKVQPIIRKRITALYNQGAIRHGSW